MQRFGQPLHGRVHETALESRVLKGIGESARRSVLVYTPPGYDESKRYPLVLMLPAFAAGHRGVYGYNRWKPNTFERLEAQILAGECEPIVVAVPDPMTRFGGGQYVDSAVSGHHQSHLVEEVIPHVDAHFRTYPEGARRAAVGRSSGGFGALRLATDRPGTIAALASHAGDALFDVTMRPMLTSAAVAYHEAGGVQPFAERMEDKGPSSPTDFDGLIVLACSMAYAPEAQAPYPHCEMPVDPNGALAGGWERWLAHDPIAHIEALTKLPDLRYAFIDAGSGDEHGLQFGAKAVADALKARGVNVFHEEHVGGHRGTSWRYEASLPAIARMLSG
ncbi:MAG: alpha/beta hydrolase-fold protein [Myxococcota bacterium]